MYNAFQQFLQPIAWKKLVVTGVFQKSGGENSKLEAAIIAVTGKNERNISVGGGAVPLEMNKYFMAHSLLNHPLLIISGSAPRPQRACSSIIHLHFKILSF
jgi:hypothetical protein